MEKYLYEDLYKQEETHWWHISKRELCIELIKNFISKPKLKILDVGCGTGKNLEAFQKFGRSFGLDSSKEAIRYCKRRGLKGVYLGSSDKTNFPDNSFDLITLLDVLEHIDERRTLSEISRILKSEGFLIITVPAFQWLWSDWDKVLHHKRRYTAGYLKRKLEENGFSVRKVSYVYSFLVLPVLIVRTIKTFLLKKRYSSDFEINLSILNLLFLKMAQLERLIMKVVSTPFGTSIVCLAQKNN